MVAARPRPLATGRAPYRISVDADEIVVRGTVITVRAAMALAAESTRSVTVAGQRPGVTPIDTRTIALDTAALPFGPHALRVDELVTAARGETLESRAVPFFVVDTPARLAPRRVIRHAARMRVGEFNLDRFAMDRRDGGPFVDVFKTDDRQGRNPRTEAFDENGRGVDWRRVQRMIVERRRRRFGAVHPTLHAVAGALAPAELVRVAVWLHTDDAPLGERDTRRPTRRRATTDTDSRLVWQRATSAFHATAARHAVTVERIDSAGPVVFGMVPAGRIVSLAARPDVAGVFLYDPEGIDDLGASIAIANADDAHAAGTTGSGVNVAVYERGPDDLTMLDVTDRYTSSPFAPVSQHARHTHAIVKNVEADTAGGRRGAPRGHAPDCNLHSANSRDLDAVRWAAQDAECTVISQSFHRDNEQSSDELSLDDIYKDHLALQFPYPTFCEAAGNGRDREYVNHKGFNRLTVGNHNDAASAMASDTVFRNPSSSHGDRELPEIAANGTAVRSVGLTLGGTSMAAPAVAGAAACVQSKAPTLRSWPEGCRAVLMAAAWRNPAGGTWRNDLVSGVDGVDGAGALDTFAAVQIAASRRGRNNSPARRGWDVGKLRSADIGIGGFARFVYRVSVPRTLIAARVKVALAWSSKITTKDFFGVEVPVSSRLTVDLDVQVAEAGTATVVANSASWDNSYEIVEFAGRRGQVYEVQIRRFAGDDDVWYGVAWTVTGLVFPIPEVRPDGPDVALGRR
jgi:hypothetical protein